MGALSLNLKGQVAIITGSTSGIGAAMAEALARSGAHIVLNGLGEHQDIETLRLYLEKTYKITCQYHDANMLHADEIKDLIEHSYSEFGRIDMLVNNAGIQQVSPIETFPIKKWNDIIAINLTSAFHTIQNVLPLMKAANYGRIINIASIHGLVASPFKSAYVAAKHGLMGLTKTVALEVAETRITVNALNPGYVKTPLVQNQIADTARVRAMSQDDVVRQVMLARQPTKRFVEYGELTGALLYLVSENGASMQGNAITIDGGWSAQ